MMKALVVVSALLCLSLELPVAHAAIGTASTPSSKYQITASEQTACGEDAVMLCSSAYPDEEKLLGCMKLNRSKLSLICRPVFDEGLRRRHLN